MNLAAIKNLKDNRKQKTDSLKNQIEAMKHDVTFSEQHKREQLEQLENEIIAIKKEYEPKIDKMIEEYKQEKQIAFNTAEYEGLSDRDINIQLLQEIRNQRLTSSLVNEYQNNSNARDELMDSLRNAINTNDSKAAAYLQTIKDLGIYAIGLSELESQYHSQNLNDEQKSIQSDINAVNELKAEYEIDVKGDPFQNRLAKYQ